MLDQKLTSDPALMDERMTVEVYFAVRPPAEHIHE